MGEYYRELQAFGKVRTSEPLAKHTTFKIGGLATYLVIVDSIDQLVALLQFLDGGGIPYMILGGGSNMLAGDAGFEGVVVKVKATAHRIDGQVLVAEAGCSTVAIAQAAMRAELTGFEWGVGVPGTIGGAVRGNAGAMGGEMGDVVTKVDAYVDGEVTVMDHDACAFEYRSSAFKQGGGVVLRVYLTLRPAEDHASMKQALDYLSYRNRTQPQGWASTGCIFKNVLLDDEVRRTLSIHIDIPPEFIDRGIVSAGWLIDRAGMKGARAGQAQISETHGNFIVNLGGATAHDVHTLIDQVKQAVYDTFGVTLEEEIAIV